METTATEPAFLRSVLGNYPTGVVAVTAADPEVGAVGMTVGSFTSVSLDPPLIAFLPAKSSTTWPKIENAGRFAVNFLASDQESVCRALAQKKPEKMSDVRWCAGEFGSPLIEDAVGWIECEVENVYDTGDHYMVVGRVLALDAPRQTLPLIFFQGGYGRFLPLSLSAWDTDLSVAMRMADAARPHMEKEAKQQGALECFAVSVVDDDLVVVATAGVSGSADFRLSVGQRVPFVAPLGGVFVAFSDDPDLERRWLKTADSRGADFASALEHSLEGKRRRGYSLGLGDWHERVDELQDQGRAPGDARERMLKVIADLDADYESADDAKTSVAIVDVPVILTSGAVPLVLSLMVDGSSGRDLEDIARSLRRGAEQVAKDIEAAQGV